MDRIIGKTKTLVVELAIDSGSSLIAVWLVRLVLAVALTACGNAAAQVIVENGSPAYGPLMKTATIDSRGTVFSTKVDESRGRYWVLGVDYVGVYRTADRRLIKRIALPGWIVATDVCAPDIALDRSGAALISSNVMPTLWRVDPDTYAVTRREITLLTRESWDVGFSGLSFAPDGTLFGRTALAGTILKIDVDQARATQLETGRVLNGC